VVSNEEDGQHHGRDDDELVQTDEAERDEAGGTVYRLGSGQGRVDEGHADAEPHGVLPLAHAPVIATQYTSDIELGHWVTGSFGSSVTSRSPGVRPEFFRFSKKYPKCKTYI